MCVFNTLVQVTFWIHKTFSLEWAQDNKLLPLLVALTAMILCGLLKKPSQLESCAWLENLFVVVIKFELNTMWLVKIFTHILHINLLSHNNKRFPATVLMEMVTEVTIGKLNVQIKETMNLSKAAHYSIWDTLTLQNIYRLTEDTNTITKTVLVVL